MPNGEMYNAWTVNGSRKQWGEIMGRYYYGSWDELVASNNYNYDHEPLMITLEAVNNEPSGTNIFVEEPSTNWIKKSLEPLCSLTAHYLEKFPRPKPLIIEKAARGTGHSVLENAVPDKTAPTDTALKGVFGRVMTAVNNEKIQSFDKAKWNQFVEKATHFVNMDEDTVLKGSAFAPFKTFVLRHWSKAPRWVMAKLDAAVKAQENTDHDTIDAWVNAMAFRTSTKRKRTERKHSGTSTEPKRKRVDDDDEYDEGLVDDFDYQYDEDEDNFQEDEDRGKEKANKGVSPSKFQALTHRVDEVEAKAHRTSRKVGELVEKLTGLEQEHATASKSSVTAEEKSELEELKAHNKEMVALMAQLATVVNILAPIQNATETDIEKMRSLASKALFNGIINQVVNVYKWDKDKKRSFYSSLKGIAAFDTALAELRD
jgi:hypothetical protein